MSMNNAPCTEIEGDLLAGTRGELDTDAAARLAGHLAGCSGCREEEARIRTVADLFARVPVVSPAPGSFLKLKQKVESQRAPRGRARWFVLTGAALAAAACLIIFLSLETAPASPEAGFKALKGEITLSDRPAQGGKLLEGARITAKSLALLEITSPRRMRLTMAAGTSLVREHDGSLRMFPGRLLAEVMPGDGTVVFLIPGGSVEVTGTVFDLNMTGSGTVVSVIEGEVRLRTGEEPVLVVSGMSTAISRRGRVQAPVAADPWRVRNWCSSPSLSASLADRTLTLTFTNPNVSPVVLKTFDPAQVTYSLLADGPGGRLPIVVQESVVLQGCRAPGESGYLSLAPGESYRLVIDLARVKLGPGEYWISAKYRPYGDLPPEAFRGSIVTKPLRVVVD